MLLYLIHPEGDGPVTVGFILGALLGYGLDIQTLNFSPQGNWQQNIIKLLLGSSVFFGLRIALKPVTNLLPGTTGDLARYAIMGFWAAYGAPWTFVRLGLAKSSKPRVKPSRLA